MVLAAAVRNGRGRVHAQAQAAATAAAAASATDEKGRSVPVDRRTASENV